jgi:hypothetical protein
MAHQSSKRGVRSDAQKRDRSRYAFDPIPATAPVEGAFGRYGETSEPVQPPEDQEFEGRDR